MKGSFIVIEGGDGSGKATQAKKLYSRLKDDGKVVRKIEFPDYKSPSSGLIKMYLNGEFGTTPDDVSPYVASTFYAVDRYASYKKYWGDFYANGGIIIADRYTTSNMIHQGAKIEDKAEREKYLNWLWDFEFNMFGLPVPDCVIFLDVPPVYTQKIIKNRHNKYTGRKNKDIHERDREYMKKVYEASLTIANRYGWHRICCIEDGHMLSIDDIHKQIYSIIRQKLLK